MRNSIPDRIQFGFQDELTKLGILQYIPQALAAAPTVLGNLSAAGRREGDAAGGFGGDGSRVSQAFGPMGNISRAVRSVTGGNQQSLPSGNFTSSASPGQVAN